MLSKKVENKKKRYIKMATLKSQASAKGCEAFKYYVEQAPRIRALAKSEEKDVEKRVAQAEKFKKEAAKKANTEGKTKTKAKSKSKKAS